METLHPRDYAKSPSAEEPTTRRRRYTEQLHGAKEATHVVREAQEAVTMPSRSRDSTAKTHESGATFLRVNCFPKLKVALDDGVPARRVTPCCRETANGSHALFNLRCPKQLRKPWLSSQAPYRVETSSKSAARPKLSARQEPSCSSGSSRE